MIEFGKMNKNLLKDFLESEKSAGYLLIVVTIISIIIANSSWGLDYTKFWKSYIDLSFGPIMLKYSLEHWINDGLMAIFFLLIGLEVEREIYVGELASIRKASLPVIAAIGGMLIPASFFLAFNFDSPTKNGFGIPMATDIAFAIGVFSILGSRIPLSLKVFITALAIIDDLGAILIIAIFYTSDISFLYLIGAFSIFIILLIMNIYGVKRISIYLLLGIIMWYCMLKSGIHATIAGVLLAFAIPFRKNNPHHPSFIIQERLHKPVAFFIIPLFALANTAIILPKEFIASILSPNAIGIISGLFLGKPVGILLFSFLAVKIGVAQLPIKVNWKLLLGASCLAGIGFTMSIFITNLAYSSEAIITSSKLSIIIASLASGLLGFLLLWKYSKNAVNNI